MAHELNFPYYLYPGTPLSGYYDIDAYNIELNRLHSEIIKLGQLREKILFHLTIGAPYEEGMFFCKAKYLKYPYQYQQLFPDHVKDFAISGGQVVSFIIAPNRTFSKDEFRDPLFIEYTNDEFDWHRNDMVYKSRKYKCIIYIFYTMMPTIDIIRNNKFFSKRNSPYLEIFRQTKYDNKFTYDFYNNLDYTLSRIINYGGLTTCYSFAVFNQNNEFRDINRFMMFKELLSVLKKDIRNVVAEWIFYDDNVCVHSLNHLKLIRYIDDVYKREIDVDEDEVKSYKLMIKNNNEDLIPNFME